MGDKIILTSNAVTADPVTPADSNANGGVSSTPDPNEHDVEPEEQSEYNSSSEEKGPGENIQFARN